MLGGVANPDRLTADYQQVRGATEALAGRLTPEDMQVQSMPDASPTKWHLAHTTWFFETLVLARFRDDWRFVDPDMQVLYNSYYNSFGSPYPRPRRGVISRPGLEQVLSYRQQIDAAMGELLAESADNPELAKMVELGLNHEEQHQELILTDILHAFSLNPAPPAITTPIRAGTSETGWLQFGEGLHDFGAAPGGFCFDNEEPRHKQWLHPFEIADQPVTNAAWSAFVDDGGYRDPQLWLSEGWSTLQEQGWTMPAYWRERDGERLQIGLAGLQPLDPEAPVAQVSYFEADAFARWAGARLPTEFEWEHAARSTPATDLTADANMFDDGHWQPGAGDGSPGRFVGDVWEWTSSSYAPYPGYRQAAGALGEYNGKFMCNQYVLRGGSCVTPRRHIRLSYRNFFPTGARWQFSGLRLARSLDGAG